MFPHDSVDIEAHGSIPTPSLTNLHHRSAMEETPEEFVGSLLRDSLEAPPTSTSPYLGNSQITLDVQPLRSRMGPLTKVAPTQNVRVAFPNPLRGRVPKSPQL
ncbi:hypothetical protein LIER_23208 [Lithospermum erythrorhizon]|uniref:Uncharacterized protein n=1 Tax=Lithospermum erythrorhizon TaxID=34254 RepID=A0AAV3QXU9_LITER